MKTPWRLLHRGAREPELRSGHEMWRCNYCRAIQRPRRKCYACGSRLNAPELSTVIPESLYPVFGGPKLDRRPSDPLQRLHILGVHVGAGESTIAALVPGSVEAEHAWPVEPVREGDKPYRTSVVLVARTHAEGLIAAQHALNEWITGDVHPVVVEGVVLIADAPGVLTRREHEAQAELLKWAPRAWFVPFLPALRLSEAPQHIAQARALARLSGELSDVGRRPSPRLGMAG